MAAGKRGSMEEFEAYRSRLKEEAAALKRYLKGKFVWVACIVVKHPKKGHLVKVRARGQYIKGRLAK